MSRSRKPARPAPLCLQPRVKVWLEAEGRYVFGLGLSDILQAVDETGSIKEAAGRLGKSYRHVWGRLKQAEEALGLRLVETHVGGTGSRRSFLSPQARQLLRDYLALRGRMREVVEQEFARRFRVSLPSDGPR